MPKQEALPPATKPVQVYRRKVYKCTKILLAVIACFGILGLILRGELQLTAFGFGAFTLFASLIIMPIWYFTARNSDRSLTSLQNNPWVHWQYSQDEWNAWVETQAQRAAKTPPAFVFKRDWRKLVLPVGIVAGGVLIFGPGTFLYRVLAILGVCGLIAGLSRFTTPESDLQAKRIRKNLPKCAPEAYLGHSGMYCEGILTAWVSATVSLRSASIDEREPRSLHCVFEEDTPSAYSGTRRYQVHRSVLIPANADEDLARLKSELARRCPKAQITFPG
jgi:hypothetical protein